jgi:hypothetical protein
MLTGSHKIVVIDEAQQIRNSGLTLKLITDHISDSQTKQGFSPKLGKHMRL